MVETIFNIWVGLVAQLPTGTIYFETRLHISGSNDSFEPLPRFQLGYNDLEGRCIGSYAIGAFT
jgi:hypothetical protein